MLNRFISLSRYTFATSLAMCLCWSSAAADDVIEFEIPAQPAAKGLNLYAEQASLQIMFPYAAVKGLETNEVVGEFDKDIALETLLADTGLEVVYGNNNTATVRPIVVTDDTEGPRDSGNSQPTPVLMAQNPTSATENQSNPAIQTRSDGEEAVQELENIIVTGSRIRGAQSASPVVTITRQDIDRAGFATVEEMLDKLPQNYGAGASLDTITDFANSDNVVGGFVDNRAGGTSVNLRGLGASSTLILLNGRRLSPSGLKARFTNISSIPVMAIERVEVLTDGASAIYGSDAIGGVVNFILRDDYEGAETRLRYGSDGRGDYSDTLFGQSFGKSWSDGNALLTYQYYNSDRLANNARNLTASNDLSLFGGTDWRGFGGNPANINAGGQLWAIPLGQDGAPGTLTTTDFPVDVNGDPIAAPNRYNSRSVGDVIPALEQHSAFVHLTQAVGPVELFAEGHFSTQENEARVNTGTVNITVSNDNPYFVDPTGAGLTSVTVANYSVEDDFGPGEGFGKIDSLGAALGVRFDMGEDWHGELVGNWAKEEATRRIRTGFDAAALATAALADTLNTAFNPFGDGSNTSPAVLATIADSTITTGTESENELWSVGLNVDGDFFDIPGGAVQVATGLEFREESLLAIDPSPFGFNIFESNRDVTAIYAEFFFPLVSNSNSRAGIQKLEFSIAGRYEDYSDFGDTVDPKIGLVWSPAQSLTLRGTWGTSFRAPALFDLDVTIPGANDAFYLPQLFVDFGVIPFPMLARTGGSEDLKAESATSWTAGFQWNPDSIKGLSIDVTYFDVDFEDRVEVPTNDIVAATSEQRWASIFNTNPTDEQIAAIVNDPRYVPDAFGLGAVSAEDILSGAVPVGGIIDLRKGNLAQSVVTGLDLQLSYGFETAAGVFDIGLNGNYLFDFERTLILADPLVDEVDTFGRPIDFRARGNVGWSRERWSVSGFVNYMDGYTDNISNPERSVNSWTTVDLTVTYETGDGSGFFTDMRLSLTTQNLFDEDPPFVNTIGGLGYDSANGNPLGRFLAFQVTKDW